MESTSSLREDTIPRAIATQARGRQPLAWEKPILLTTGALRLLGLLFTACVSDRLWRKTPSDATPLTLAYQALEQGDWPRAETLLQQLEGQPDKRVQSQRYAGLAALAFGRRDVPQALAFAGQAEAMDPEIAYSHVIRGHILLSQGKTRERQDEGWTSTPVTLAFLDVQVQGTLASSAGEDEFLMLRLVEGLRVGGRIEIVERAILEKLLAELQLSTTDLVDPQVALRVGKIRAARLIATGSFTHVGTEGRLALRMVETETTRIKASAVEVVEQPRGVEGVVELASSALLQTLRDAYPLQGRIAHITPQGVILNIGAAQGMTSGLAMQVFGTDEPIELDGRVVGYRRLPVGLIEVTTVEATLSQAKVLEQTEPFQPGWKVKEVQRN